MISSLTVTHNDSDESENEFHSIAKSKKETTKLKDSKHIYSRLKNIKNKSTNYLKKCKFQSKVQMINNPICFKATTQTNIKRNLLKKLNQCKVNRRIQ
jgi:hypothetical protein